MEIINKIWGITKPFIGIAFKGAKWYVKVRYGVDVDQILKESQEEDQQDGAQDIKP